MTFDNAAWAIDGATMRSSLARAQSYVASSGAQGVSQKGDLKVSELDDPSNGLLISSGSALILNGYQGDITVDADQSYTVTNQAVHTVTSDVMPTSNGSAKSYIVAIAIGDPEFPQVGHPFMGGGDPPSGEEATFEYVRAVVIPCSSGAKSLPVDIGFPALPLARLDVPPSTTTITNDMIVDLRSMARPRSQLVQDYVSVSSGDNVVNSWNRLGGTIITVVVPPWAVTARVVGFVEGMRIYDSGAGKLSAYVESDNRSTPNTNINESSVYFASERRTYNVGGNINVSDIAGTTQKFSLRAETNSSGDNDFLRIDTSTGLFLSVYFEEAPL